MPYIILILSTSSRTISQGKKKTFRIPPHPSYFSSSPTQLLIFNNRNLPIQLFIFNNLMYVHESPSANALISHHFVFLSLTYTITEIVLFNHNHAHPPADDLTPLLVACEPNALGTLGRAFMNIHQVVGPPTNALTLTPFHRV